MTKKDDTAIEIGLKIGGHVGMRFLPIWLQSASHNIADGLKKEGLSADLAADTFIVRDNFRTSHQIDANSVYRTGALTPGFFALSAGIRRETAFVVESKNLDVGSRRVEHPGMLVGTSHLALKTAGTFSRVDIKRLLHFFLLVVIIYSAGA